MTEAKTAIEVKSVKLGAITITAGTQPRAAMDQHTVDEYAEAIRDGVKLPPVTCFRDSDNNLYLADGFHRYHAHIKAARHSIRAEIYVGTLRDAILHSVGANATHGLRRSNADKRRAVETLLNDPEWSGWTDNQIARQCAVHHTTVTSIRDDLTCYLASENNDSADIETSTNGHFLNVKTGNNPPEVPDSAREKFDEILAGGGTPRFYRDRHGNVGVMDVSNIGAKPTPSGAVDDPFADDEPESLTGNITSQTDDDPFSDDEPEVTVSSVPTLKERATNAEVVHDTIVEQDDLTDDEWLAQWAIWRVVSKQAGKGVVLRRSLLDYRIIEKALKTFAYHASRLESVKHHDGTQFSNIIGSAAHLLHPRSWRVCPPCRGNGCHRCASGGYDVTGAGIDPCRVENGEVKLNGG